MPQMAPLSWLTLFILFTVLYILFTIINYFSSHPTPPAYNTQVDKKASAPFNWQW